MSGLIIGAHTGGLCPHAGGLYIWSPGRAIGNGPMPEELVGALELLERGQSQTISFWWNSPGIWAMVPGTRSSLPNIGSAVRAPTDFVVILQVSHGAHIFTRDSIINKQNNLTILNASLIFQVLLFHQTTASQTRVPRRKVGRSTTPITLF